MLKKNFKAACRSAFSLIELLIALISIACITAAFTPVITKKLSTEKSINGGMGGDTSGNIQSHLFKFEQNQAGCSANANGDNQITCALTIPENTTKVGVILSGGGGGGGGAGQPRAENGTFNDDTTNASSGLTIIPELKNVVIQKLIGSGGGGGGGSVKLGSYAPKTTTTASGNQTVSLSGVQNVVITSMVGGGGAGGSAASRESAWIQGEPMNAWLCSGTVTSNCAWEENRGTWTQWEQSVWNGNTNWTQSGSSMSLKFDSSEGYCYLAGSSCWSSWSWGQWDFNSSSNGGWTWDIGIDSNYWCDVEDMRAWAWFDCITTNSEDTAWGVWTSGVGWHSQTISWGVMGASWTSGVWLTSCSNVGGGGSAGSYLTTSYSILNNKLSTDGTMYLNRGASGKSSYVIIKNGSGSNTFTFEMPYGIKGQNASAPNDGSSCYSGNTGISSNCNVKINGTSTSGYSACGASVGANTCTQWQKTSSGSSSPLPSFGFGGGSSKKECVAWAITANKNSTGATGTAVSGTTYGSGGSAGASGGVGYISVQYDKRQVDSYNGGGGQSGAMLQNFVIPDIVLKNNIGGKIYVTKGASVSGGTGAESANASVGSTGNPSKVEVRDSSGNVKWSIEVSGGAGGKGGTTSDAGGTSDSSCSLKIFDGTSTTSYFSATDALNAGITGFSCGVAGGAGNIALGGVSSSGGTGGALSGVSYGIGGTGGVNGGTGATSTAGRVEMSYQKVFITPSGGGGGGGAYYTSGEDNINVTPMTTLSIAVGGGGVGGSGAGTISVSKPSTDGGNGASSFVNFGSYSLTANGGYGGKCGVTNFANDTITYGAGGLGATVSPGNDGLPGAIGHNTGAPTPFATIGGAGGLGGIHAENPVVAPCGGMQAGSSCASSAQGASIEKYNPDSVEMIGLEPKYTSSFVSAGGGGGGYDGAVSGDGGYGQGGFVYIWYRI